jgi:hypothetical protein
MTLIGLVLTLVVIGIALWLFNKYVTTIDPTIKTIINVVVIVVVVLIVLNAFGVLGTLDQPVPRLR